MNPIAADLVVTDEHRAILRVLGELSDGGGFVTGDITRRLPYQRDDLRAYSATTRKRLLELRKAGLVRMLDDQKPDVWCITAEGVAERDRPHAP